MIRRIIAAMFLLWALGFIWFAAALPQPLTEATETDAIIVPTGGAGRIPRGLQILEKGLAQEILVTGVDPEVKPAEFAEQFNVPSKWMRCCVTLGFSAVDTRGNAAETAKWLEERNYSSIRLVTTDWHMRRAAGEISRSLPDDITIVRDAVPSEPSLANLFLEYHKLLASWLVGLWPSS